MIRNALFASMIVFGAAAAAGAAQAQDRGPQLIGGGADAQVVYAEPSRNLVGGAFATVTGGGEDRTYVAAPGSRTEAGNGLVARAENVNGETQVVYGPAGAAFGTMMAGTTARPRG